MVHTSLRPKMLLPEILNLGFERVPTLVIILMLGVLYWVFVLWYESRKDGFDSDKMFDLTFISIFVGAFSLIGLLRLLHWTKIYRPNSFLNDMDRQLLIVLVTFLVSLIPVLIATKRWKWSLFRILDIYSLAFSLLGLFLSLGAFLIYGRLTYALFSVLIVGLYFMVLRFRGYKFMSGLIFSLFLFFLTISGLILFRDKGYLLFYPILFIIGLVNLYFRRKKSMAKNMLPKELLASLKSILVKKEKELEEQQEQLIKEDPYMKEGRTTGNSEIMDEVVIEDVQKNVTDARLNLVKGLSTQVKKALAFMKIGKYGICEVCGNKIDTARLKAYPEATTCISCAEDISQKESVEEI